MNRFKRAKMVMAMDEIVTSLNNESNIDAWLMGGVADGDITSDTTWKDVPDYYLEDNTFADLMALFMRIMRYALEDEEFDEDDRHAGNGLLYCNGIVSKRDDS